MARYKTDRNGNWLIATLTVAAVLAIGGIGGIDGIGATPAFADEPAEILTLDLAESHEPQNTETTWPAFREGEEERPMQSIDAGVTTTSFEDRQPVLAAPLPPAVLAGGALLAANLAVSMISARRQLC